MKAMTLVQLDLCCNKLKGADLFCFRLLTKVALEMTLYIYVYENWRLTDLPWDSSVTWCLSFVAMDFAYYWFHRAAHGKADYYLFLS